MESDSNQLTKGKDLKKKHTGQFQNKLFKEWPRPVGRTSFYYVGKIVCLYFSKFHFIRYCAPTI